MVDMGRRDFGKFTLAGAAAGVVGWFTGCSNRPSGAAASSAAPVDYRHRRLLLLSSSKTPGDGEWLHWAEKDMAAFLRKEGTPPVRRLAFVGYAGVTVSAADYLKKANGVFTDHLGFQVSSVDDTKDPQALLAEADGILVAGGNTYMLNHLLHESSVRDIIRHRVLRGGVPYVGWSAGSVVAFDNMSTTNDMRIVEMQSAAGLGLVAGPVRLNVHFADPVVVDTLLPEAKALAEKLMQVAPETAAALRPRGETREDRLMEYLAVPENKGPVIGLREGGILLVEGERMTLRGEAGAKVFYKGRAEPVSYAPGADLSALLAVS